MEWTRLQDSRQLLNDAYNSSKGLHRISPKELVTGNLPFGYPEAKPVYLSMLLIRQWFKKAGVEIYFKGLDKLQKMKGYRNIITPNHPNLFDSLVTRYLFYLGGQFVPFTAAVDTLSRVPGIAKILKANGTFFINTKRFDDMAYREQVNSFMRDLTDAGEWLQFYVEGDRGAHERQRVPRRGLLKAVVDKPCMFFPVSVSYEKIVTSYLNGIGKVYVEIHDPIAHHPAQEFTGLVNNLVETIQRGVNAYTTDIVATLLLYYGSGQTRLLQELERDVQWLQAVIVSREVPFVEVKLETVLQFLEIKKHNDKVKVPLESSPEYLRLIHYRERILHTLYDLADPPNFIAKEFAWTPPTPLIHDEQVKAVASNAVSPLVQMYSSIITLLDQGVQTVKQIEEAITTPIINVQMLRNTLRLLREQKIITVEANGVIKLN